MKDQFDTKDMRISIKFKTKPKKEYYLFICNVCNEPIEDGYMIAIDDTHTQVHLNCASFIDMTKVQNPWDLANGLVVTS